MKRRAFIAAPAFIGPALAARHPIAEIERMLARGDVKGKLTRDDLPTPALCVDLDAFEANVTKMVAHAKNKGRALRPHAKTHKCSEIGRRLIRAGAVGACAAKLAEAEVLADAGVTGILLTGASVGPTRIERAVRLARKHPDTIFSVDSASNVDEMNAAARAAKIRLNVAIDLYVGRRTGILSGAPALGLAQQIDKLPGLKLHGIQAYAGHCAHIKGFAERKKGSTEQMAEAISTRRMLEQAGIACNWLSGGSTGTYNIDCDIDGLTELQPGSFMFMDIDYNRIGGQEGEVYRDFQNSLTVLTSVISIPKDENPVVDGGLKAFSTDKPFVPEAKGLSGISYRWGGDEHGVLTLAADAPRLKLNDRVEFLVPHCDPSVNLYDRLFACRGQQVEAVWAIDARGRGY